MVSYKCSKCNRVWQHPVKTCPYCMIELEREKSFYSAKVLAVSKVLIPSLLHPKVPYYSLLLEDEGGVKYAYKSSEKKKAGDIIEFSPNRDKDAVAIWRINYDILDGVEAISTLVGGLDINKDSNVLILPTLNTPNHAYFRENTSPEFLEAILKFLYSKNVTKISIASQSFSDLPIEALAQKSGLLETCLKNKVALVDLSKGDFKKEGELEISDEFLKADLVINLATAKGGKAAATENLFKSLKKENYSALKYLFSEDYISKKLVNYSGKVFTFGEAYFVQRPDKFTTYWGAIFGSRNYVNLDRVFNETGMIKEMPKILKDVKIENIPIVGRNILEVQRDINIVL